MSIGERIKQRRQELGLSVDEIARQLGKNRATIYRYEGDEIENLPLNILEPLAKVLRVSPAYIMGWDTDMPDYQVRYVPLLVAIEDGRLVLGEDKVHYHAGGANAVEVDFCLRIDDANMVDTRIQHGDYEEGNTMALFRRRKKQKPESVAAEANPLKPFYSKIAGVTRKNADGTSRQRLLN